MFEGMDYWKNYMTKWFGEDLIGKWHDWATEVVIESNQREMHLEVYDTGNPEATTIVFSHGIAGYARVLLPFIAPLREKGYNLVIPDLQGYGYNEGVKGDFEWNIHVRNLVDAVRYAKGRFSGKIVLGGASMGGPLAYAAASRSLDIDALVCWCLWDFSDREFMLKETNTKGMTYILTPLFRWMSALFGDMRIKTYRLISYDTLTDSAEMNDMVKNDPQAGTHITLRGAASLLTQSKPIIPHEDFTLPVLVFQPGEDKMVPKYYSKRTFKTIGSKVKRLIELEGAAHFPTQKRYYVRWAEEADVFLKQL